MRRLRDFWRRIPLKVMLVVIAACLMFGEQYPFSDFPMFGSFVGKTYYLYLADQNGKAIPAMSFGVPTNGIKKFYDGRLRRLKLDNKAATLDSLDDRAVARQTLEYLLPKARKKHPNLTSLQLVRVDVAYKDREITKETRVAAEVPFP